MRVRSNLAPIGAVTWLIVGAPSLAWELSHHHLFTTRGLTWLAAFVAFIVCYLVANWSSCARQTTIALNAAQSLLALVCVWLQPAGFQAILLVIVAAELGGLSMRIAASWIAAQSVAFGVLLYLGGNDAPIAVTFAYLAFQLFGAVSVHRTLSEAQAREELARTNAELRMTTALLDMNSRASERLRIARDLHDLLGHHLTALSLNLEVASHLADGEARESIEKSKSITKLLLSDVRDTVSSLRDDEPVDLGGALRSLRDAITTPAVHLEVANDVAVADAAIAQAALRAVQEIVTNAVRHSGARNLWLRLKTHEQSLDIDARDDGSGTDDLRIGNGLRGMRERVEQVRGSVDVSSSRGGGFSVHVRLPLVGEVV
jgi:signal transduction histidine kinase